MVFAQSMCHDARAKVECIWVQAAHRHAEERASAALREQQLQEQLAAEQSATATERQVRERAEQQVAELKVAPPHSTDAMLRAQRAYPIACGHLAPMSERSSCWLLYRMRTRARRQGRQ